MSALASCTDDSFGPWAGATCRGGFDFTLLFEEAIFSILFTSLFLLAALTPIVKLAREPVKVRSSPLKWFKQVRVSLPYNARRMRTIAKRIVQSNCIRFDIRSTLAPRHRCWAVVASIDAKEADLASSFHRSPQYRL